MDGLSGFTGGGNAYDSAYPVEQSAAKMVRMPTMKDRLAEAVAHAEAKLADARRAKEIFDAHPELEELLNIMQRGRF